jgi:hypothetical protein
LEQVVATERQRVIEQVRAWLEELVIGLDLCPFAAAPVRGGRVRYTVCDASGADDIFQAFLAELDAFLQLPASEAETGLFILSRGLQSFDDYLDMLALLEQALADAGLEGIVQLASFHPDYVFAGSEADDPANYSNRAPYPIFHLIREQELEKVLANYPDPGAIPERNIARLRELGLAELQRRLAALRAGGTP